MSRVVLKGELHTSRADLEEAKSLVMDGADTVVFEGKERSATDIGLTESWFALAVYSYFWILESVYVADDILVDLARANGIDIRFTRRTDLSMLEDVPIWLKTVAAGTFYLLIPASIWIGFLTGSQLTGAYLLFIGIVSPIFMVRAYALKSRSNDFDREIALEIERAVRNANVVLVIVGQGHLDGIIDELPSDIDPEVFGPKYDPWSINHIRDIGLPMFKAGLILFSLYLLSVWLTIGVVDSIAPFL